MNRKRTINALYLQKFNPKSLLSLLPNDIFKKCLLYVKEDFKQEKCRLWIVENDIDIEYLKIIRQMEVENNVIFPIKPVLEMADKNWKKDVICRHRNLNRDIVSYPEGTYDPGCKDSFCYLCCSVTSEPPIFFCAEKEFCDKSSYFDLIGNSKYDWRNGKLYPIPYKIDERQWAWNIGKYDDDFRGYLWFFIIYDNPKELNPKMCALSDDIPYYDNPGKSKFWKPNNIKLILDVYKSDWSKVYKSDWFDSLPRWEDKYHVDRSVDIFKEYPDITIEYLCKKLI